MSNRNDLEQDIVEEDEVHALLAGGERDLLPPPYAVVERRLRRAGPGFGALALGTLAAAMFIGVITWRVGAPAASPAPAAAPSAAPAASGEQHGLLFQRADGGVDVRTELDLAVVAALDGPISLLVVSPDGRDVAYWSGTDDRELWVARISELPQRQRLLTLADERGVGIVWSADGTDLMIGVGPGSSDPSARGAPGYTALRVLGRDGSALRELGRVESGQPVRPLAWDPIREVGAAVESLGQKGPGRYVMISPGSVRFADLPDASDLNVVIGDPQASTDARYVMATWNYAGQDLVRFWPLEGLDSGRLRELKPETMGQTVRGAAWRPQSLEIGVDVSGNFQLWTLDGQRRHVREFGGSAALWWFRHDGRALYSGTAGRGRIEVTELGTAPGPVRDLPAPDGLLLGSVTLSSTD